MTLSITSSEIKAFQSNGDAGRVPACIRVLIFVSVGFSDVLDSLAKIAFHSVWEILESHVRTSAILPVGARKKFG